MARLALIWGDTLIATQLWFQERGARARALLLSFYGAAGFGQGCGRATGEPVNCSFPWRREMNCPTVARSRRPGRAALLVSALRLLSFGGAFAIPSAAAQPEIVVWLLPAEPGLQPSSADTTPTDEDVDRLNRELVPPGVVLENTADPRLRAQLGVWNPEFAVPNIAWLRGQTVTLKALGRFASVNNVQIRVRFWTWASIFSALQGAIARGGLPDVSQVGSGWIASLQDRHLLEPFGGAVAAAGRRDYAGVLGASLRYTNDIRLLFFWRRLPRRGSAEFSVDRSSWQTLIKSLDDHQGPPIAFPIGATLNVIHDLLPLMNADPARLFHSGFTGPYVSFDSASLEVPLLFSNNSLVYDSRRLPRRLIAFPEMAHEEALRSFVAGGYTGIIEPVGFLRRWFDEFATTTSKQPGVGSFWQHADVVAPPTAFKGGSDLVVFKGARSSTLAQSLALFLASDPDYTRMLAENGNLPVLRGREAIALLMGPIANSGESRAAIARISDQIDLSDKSAREEPSLASWPTEIESREVIESFQNVWRRMADSDKNTLKQSMDELEGIINRRINPAIQVKVSVLRIWPFLSVFLLATGGFITWNMKQKAEESDRARLVSERARRESDQARLASEEAHRQSELARAESDQARLASERSRKLQGFTAAALGVVDNVHRRKGPYAAPAGGPSLAEKSAQVAVGLDGWLRGLDPLNWEPRPLRDVIWRSILLALDFQIEPGIYELWSAGGSGAVTPEHFLRERELLRVGPEPDPSAVNKVDLYFGVDCAPEILIDTPFMIEQCLTCILQNAVAASVIGPESNYKSNTYRPIEIHVTPESMQVRNSCTKTFSQALAAVLNADLTVNEFANRVRSLLTGPIGDRPGLGSIISTLIARECYGGLHIAVDEGETRTTVRLRPGAHGRWCLSPDIS